MSRLIAAPGAFTILLLLLASLMALPLFTAEKRAGKSTKGDLAR